MLLRTASRDFSPIVAGLPYLVLLNRFGDPVTYPNGARWRAVRPRRQWRGESLESVG